MLVKIITVSFDLLHGGFRDDLLRDFLKDCEVLELNHHFFLHHDLPYFTFVVKYLPKTQELSSQKKEDPWKSMLLPSDFGLYSLFKEWRGKRAIKDGVPPYVLFTNKQLAQITKSRPQSLGDLLKIEGIGQARVNKYGNDLLEISKIKDMNGQEKNETPSSK